MAEHISDEELLSRIYKELLQDNNEPSHPPKETRAKHVHRRFAKGDIQMAWIYQEMTIETTTRRVKTEILTMAGSGKYAKLPKLSRVGGKYVTCTTPLNCCGF